MDLDSASLKSRRKKERDNYPDSVDLRIYRALSWLERSEQCQSDSDARFIFLWIAFNAAYANDIESYEVFTEQRIFGEFIAQIVNLDKQRLLHGMVWSEFSSSIRVLLENKYVFGPFWDYHNGKSSEQEWRKKFDRDKSRVHRALSRNDTRTLLIIVFSRLYILRNQLMHGAATWDGAVNREQVRDGTCILAKFVPFVIHIMMDNPNALRGKPYYPVVE